MSRICSVTGKRPVKGRRIIHRGQSKKSGGIGFQLVKQTKRTFKRQWVSVKALKAGLVTKA
jgi:large subunit ribosomal protein L28